MPSPPYAKLLVQVNGGALQSGAIYPSVGDTIRLSAESVAFWQQQRFEIYDFPSTFALPAGWSDTGTGVYFYAADPYPPTFVVSPWGKFMLRLTVNRSLNGAGKLDANLVDESTALSTASTNLGLRDLGFLESSQFSAEREWTGDEKANLRILDTFAGTIPGGLSSATPQTVAASGSAGVSVLASRGDHAHAHGNLAGGSLHASVVASGASGFMSGADKAKLDGITAGAAVLSVGATLPLTSTGGTAPVLAINPASGVAAGSMSLADYTKVAGLPIVGFAAGGLLYSFTSSTYDFVAAAASGNVLLSNGVSTPPTYGKANLSVHVTGTLPVTNGGTGLASYSGGDLLCASAPGTIAVVSDVVLGNVLLSGGVGSVPAYGKVALSVHVTGTLPVGNGGTNITSYATGDILFAAGSTTLSALNVGATGTVLHGGATPTYSVVSLTADVAGVLPAANGGSGQSGYTVGDLLYASGSSALSKLAAVATGNALLSGGVGVAPAYGKVGLTTHVSGTLPVASGGTGQTTTGAFLVSAFFFLDVTLVGGTKTQASGKNLSAAVVVSVILKTPSVAVGSPTVVIESNNVVVTSYAAGAVQAVTDASTYTVALVGWV